MHGKLRAQGTDTKVGDCSGKDDNSDDGNKGETSTTPTDRAHQVHVSMMGYGGILVRNNEEFPVISVTENRKGWTS